MSDYGFWSLLPPVVAVALAIRTKQVYLSLFTGILVGWIVFFKGNILTGSLGAIEALVSVFNDAGQTRTVLFTLLIGALIVLIGDSGGVAGFVNRMERFIFRLEDQKQGKSRVIVQLITFLTGMLIFVESNISIITTGTLYRPVFDRLKISREKLAYLIDSSSAPSCILVPANAWGAFIMAQLAVLGVSEPMGVLLGALPYNFYAFFAIATALILIISGKDFGPMRKAEKRVSEGHLFSKNARSVMSIAMTEMHMKEGVTPRTFNMLIPILTMIIVMPVMLLYTGWGDDIYLNNSLQDKLIYALENGSGSAAVLYSVIIALFIAVILYKFQGILTIKTSFERSLKGISGMVPLALIMVLAFATGDICKQLGTGNYIAEVSRNFMIPETVPAAVFLTSCAIAFSTGTSWGTFAVMLSIAVPTAESLGADIHLTVAAVLGGGVFGDHCSPISDTTVLASGAAATDHIDHVKTQLPYALTAGVAAFLFYLVFGFL